MENIIKLIVIFIFIPLFGLTTPGNNNVRSAFASAEEAKIPHYILFEQDGFTVIKTPAENIKPETIRSPLCSDYVRDKGYFGVNAGFFNTLFFRQKPDDDDFISVSVSWSIEDAENGLEVCEVSRRDLELIALGEPPYIARGTLFLHKDDGKYEAGIISAENRSDLATQIKFLTGKDYDYIYMIGGGNFYLNEYPDAADWDKWKEEKYLVEGPRVNENTALGRTGIGIKKENGVWYAYMAASGTKGDEIPKTLEELRNLFINLECSDAIYLDGAGSSQMRCADNDGELIEKPGDNRYIWSMVRLINLNY